MEDLEDHERSGILISKRVHVFVTCIQFNLLKIAFFFVFTASKL